jgi:hypothetical protein
VRSTAAPYTESRLTRSVANERVGFPVVEQRYIDHCKGGVLERPLKFARYGSPCNSADGRLRRFWYT